MNFFMSNTALKSLVWHMVIYFWVILYILKFCSSLIDGNNTYLIISIKELFYCHYYQL